MWAGLHQRLLPDRQWFDVIRERGRLAAAPVEAPPVTGSLAAPAAAIAPAPAQPQ
jgi:hypothetical protein